MYPKIALILIIFSSSCIAMRRSGKSPDNPRHKLTQSEFHAAQKLTPNYESKAFLEREQNNRNGSDVFAYHGCSSHLHPVQDFYKALHSIKELKKPVSFEHPHKESFIFLRNHAQYIPCIGQIDRPSTVGKASRKENGKCIDDRDKKLRAQLLACSYSLCDDEYGESALYFFKNNFSQLLKHKDDAIIDEQFSTLDKKHGISKIYETLKPTSGSLLQIIIPEHLVNLCAYVSRPYGFTYHNNPTNDPHFFKNNEIGILQFIDQVRKGTFRVDRWQGPPQLRLILTQRYFANPQSDIKIYRYTTASEEAINSFMQERVKLYEKIIPDLEKV